MSKKKSTKKEVLARLEKAKQHVHETGIKGHSFALGTGIASIQERFDIKGTLKDVGGARHLLADVQEKIKSHEIEESEGTVYAIDYDVIDGADNAYKAGYKGFLLLAKMIARTRAFKKEAKITNKQADDIFGDAEKKIRDLLHRQLAQVDGVMKTIKGKTAVALLGKELLTSDWYIARYMRMRGEARAAFKNEHKIEALLAAKNKPADFVKQIKALLAEDIDAIGDELTDLNYELQQLAKLLNQAESIVEAALPQHELPEAFVREQQQIYAEIEKLFHKQVENMHLLINQLDAVSSTLSKAA